VVFSDAQWAELRRTFPDGVCDVSKPGEDRVRTNVWQSYQDAGGKVIHGGRPLGRAARRDAPHLPDVHGEAEGRAAQGRAAFLSVGGYRGQRGATRPSLPVNT
jgi:hypothetical protein